MWTAKGNGVPGPWVACAALSANRKIYAFRSDERRGSIDVYVFHPNCYRWDLVQANPLSDGRPCKGVGFTVEAYGDFVYLWGGNRNGEQDNSVYRLHTSTMAWSRPEVTGEVPESTATHSSCLVGHRMYIVGGSWTGSSQAVHFLDLERMQWHRVPTNGEAVTNARTFHTACVIGTRMYVWGGGLYPFHSRSYDNSIIYLETTTATWVRPDVEGKPPKGRIGHSAFVHKGEMYIFGGFNHGLHFSDVHKYNPENSRWTQVTLRGSGPCARRLHRCCMVDDKVYIFNGLRPRPPDMHQEMPAPDRGMYDAVVLTDLHVLDFAPTLRTLCLVAVIDRRLDVSSLPSTIRREIWAMAVDVMTCGRK